MSFSRDDFAKALDQHDYAFQPGSRVRGEVFSLTSEGAYVDIGGKAAAFLPLREVSLKPVTNIASVLTPKEEREFLIIRGQDANGQVLLSLRKLEVQQLWLRLAEKQANEETVTAKVTGTNKGGVVVEVEGLRGFVPRSHLRQTDDLADLVGQKLTLSFLEVNSQTNRLVLSERRAAQVAAMGNLQLGQLVTATVASIKPFGVFLDFEGTTGLLHINQVSKGFVSALNDLFQPGQEVKAIIVDIDEAKGRIALSTQVLEKYPGELLKQFEEVMATADERAQSIKNVLAERDR